MDSIQQLSEAARQLTAAEIRQRLAEMDKESRILRALLRETLRRERRPAEGVAQ
jgi:hypothetical protein